MLSEDEIRTLELVKLADGSPAPREHYDQTSYNLRLGAEYWLIADSGKLPHVGDCSTGTRVLRIPPFACALVGTDEILDLPADVYGRWGLKIRHAMSGLIFQAGPQIEPGSRGRMFGLLFNLSSSPRELHFQTPLWSIDFSRTGISPPADEPARATPATPPPVVAAPPDGPGRGGGPKGPTTWLAQACRRILEKLDSASPAGPPPKTPTTPLPSIGTYTQFGTPAGSISEIYASFRKLSRETGAKMQIYTAVLLAVVTIIATVAIPISVNYSTDARLNVERLEARVAQLEKSVPVGGEVPSPSAQPSQSTAPSPTESPRR